MMITAHMSLPHKDHVCGNKIDNRPIISSFSSINYIFVYFIFIYRVVIYTTELFLDVKTCFYYCSLQQINFSAMCKNDTFIVVPLK